mgnify:CR=1 FL=1
MEFYEYKEKTNYVVPKDVIKERNKRAYQKRKEKMEKDKVNTDVIDNYILVINKKIKTYTN